MIEPSNSTAPATVGSSGTADPVIAGEAAGFVRIREDYSRVTILPYPASTRLEHGGAGHGRAGCAGCSGAPGVIDGFLGVIGKLIETIQDLIGRLGSSAKPTPASQPDPQSQLSPTPDTPVASPQPQLDVVAKTGLGDAVKALFGAGRKALSEEQLQAAVVYDQLKQENPEAAQRFLGAFKHERRKLKGQDDRVENSVKRALQKVAEEGLIDRARLRQIQGLANKAAEFDGKKGLSNVKEGSLEVETAVSKAEQTLQQIDSGALPPPPPASLKPTNSEKTKEKGKPGSTSTTKDPEFLWKPISDSDGKLAVLLPSKYTGLVDEVAIYSDVPPSKENLIEKGRYSGVGNGDRTHFRFTKPGGSYPSGVYVVATLKDGSTVQFKIDNPSQRS